MVRTAQCPVCVSCVYSLNFWDRVWFLVSVTRSAAGSVLRGEPWAMLAAGPGRPRGGPGPGLTVNTSAGSHCRGSVHRAARSPEQGAELGEGGGHSTCVTSNSPPLREFYVEIMKTIFVMRFLNYGHNSPSATSIDKIQQASVTQVLLSIELFNTSILVAAWLYIITMSRVDLKTNETELLKARNSILNDDTMRKYVIFGKDSIMISRVTNPNPVCRLRGLWSE